MQKYGKFGALLLAFVLIFATLVPTVSADFSDLASGHRYYDAIYALTSKGIINGFEDGTFRPEDTVTRAQFAKIVTYALGVGDVALSGSDTGFTDVAAEHWAAGNIKTAFDMGIINGMGDGTFCPEDPVTYEQAVKMAVASIGYGPVAMNRGGYPDGYMQVGSSLGFVKNIVDGEIGIAAKRGTIAKLIHNMMSIEILNSDGSVSSGSTLDKNIHNSDSVKGQVTAVYGTSLDDSSHDGLNKFQIRIGRTVYSIENLKDSIKNNISDYLGKLVIAYYTEDAGNDIAELTNIVFQQNRNNELQITDDMIEEYSNSEIKYFDEKADRSKSFDVNSDASILYNGKATNDKLETVVGKLLENGGKIRFLDTTGGTNADVVFVQTFETYYVSRVDSNNFKIYDKYDTTRSVVLNPNDRSKKIEFKRDGTSATFTDIKVDSIVSVAASQDGTLYTVLISTTSIRGTVTSVTSDDGKYEIAGKTYKISPSYNKYLNSSTDKIEVGTTATFRIDALGKIAAATIDAAKAYTYGYLVEAEKTSSATDSSVAAKIYPITSSGSLSHSIYTFASNVKYNGETIKTNTTEGVIKILSNLKNDAIGLNTVIEKPDKPDEYILKAENIEHAQIVKYTLNSSNQIDKIVTKSAVADKANALDVNTEYVTADGVSYSSQQFVGKYTINSNTRVIQIPDDRYENNYKKISLTNGKKYRVQLIDVTEGNYVPVVLVFGVSDDGVLGIDHATKPVIVSSAYKEVEHEGEYRHAITVTTINGEEKIYYQDLKNDIDLTKLAVGDVIRISSDSSNYIDQLEIVAKPSALEAKDIKLGNNAGIADAQYRAFVGVPLRKVDNNLVAAAQLNLPAASDAITELTFNLTNNVKVYTVDLTKSTKKIESSFVEDIIPLSESRIFLYSSYSSVELIVIFKGYTAK